MARLPGRWPIFRNSRLSVETKRKVYQATVLSVLLYGMDNESRNLSGFHNRTIMRHRKWKERISSRQMTEGFGMEESMRDIRLKHRMRWLGHVARMEPHRIPKQLLFGELLKKRPSHGAKKRWRDLAAADVKALGVSEDWYDIAQDRKEWRATCKDGLDVLLNQHRSHGICAANSGGNKATTYPCSCGRSFRRQGDLTRHSRFCGGTSSNSRPRAGGARSGTDEYVCPCGRSFRRRGDLTRHGRSRMVAQQGSTDFSLSFIQSFLPKDTTIISIWVALRSKVRVVCVCVCACVFMCEYARVLIWTILKLERAIVKRSKAIFLPKRNASRYQILLGKYRLRRRWKPQLLP